MVASNPELSDASTSRGSRHRAAASFVFNRFWPGAAALCVRPFSRMPGSWEWSPSALEVLRLANSSLPRWGHSYVSSPHLILGLLMLQKGGAAYVLKDAGLSLELVERFLSSRTDPP